MATLHRQGVCLWGGPSWEMKQRFAHPLVKLIDFSPNDQYLVTWSHDPVVVPEGSQQGPQYFTPEDEGNNVAVWEIKTGHLLRTFFLESDDKKQLQWPALKWSADDKYVGRVTLGQQISVYELPHMGLQGKKSMKVEGVIDFEWCPLGEKDREEAEKEAAAAAKSGKPKKVRENLLAYWTPEVTNQPARVTVMSFPSRTILRQKNLFNVTEVSPPTLPKYFSHAPISAKYIGKIKETSCASRSIDTPKPRSRSSVTSKYSWFGRRISQLRWLSTRVIDFIHICTV